MGALPLSFLEERSSRRRPLDSFDLPVTNDDVLDHDPSEFLPSRRGSHRKRTRGWGWPDWPGAPKIRVVTYRPEHHAEVASLVGSLDCRWMVSYDDNEEIRKLYEGLPTRAYGIVYTAQDRYRGREVAFFSKGLRIPEVRDPARMTAVEVQAFQARATASA